jgi:hypothetical protein
MAIEGRDKEEREEFDQWLLEEPGDKEINLGLRR